MKSTLNYLDLRIKRYIKFRPCIHSGSSYFSWVGLKSHKSNGSLFPCLKPKERAPQFLIITATTIRNFIFRRRLWKDAEDVLSIPATPETAAGCICALQLSSLNRLLTDEIKGALNWRQLRKEHECSLKYLLILRGGFARQLQKEIWNPVIPGLHMAPPLTCHHCNQQLLYNRLWYKKRNKIDTYPPSKILILTGSPLLVTTASSSGFPLLSSSFSALVISFRPSLERSEGKWTYLPKRAKQSLITYNITLQTPQTKHCRLKQQPSTQAARDRTTSQEIRFLLLDFEPCRLGYVYNDLLEVLFRCMVAQDYPGRCWGESEHVAQLWVSVPKSTALSLDHPLL